MTISQFDELLRLQRVLGLSEGDLLSLARAEGVTFQCCARNLSDLSYEDACAVIRQAQQLEQQYAESAKAALVTVRG